MRYSYPYSLVLTLLVTLFSSVSALAQAEEVDVRQITFHAVRHPAIPSFRMLVRRTSGEEVEYLGTGDALVNQVTSCGPCQLPSTLSSNVYQDVQFPDGSTGMTYRAALFQSGKYVRFHVDHVTSPPLVYDIRQTWRPHDILKRASTTLTGRVEIFDQNDNLVAFDNNVELQGVTDVYMSLFINDGARSLYFAALISILDAPL